MKTILDLLVVSVLFLIGIVFWIMALKSIFATSVEEFYEKILGQKTTDLPSSIKYVILSLYKLSGFGFIFPAIALTFFPLIFYFHAPRYVIYSLLCVPYVSFLGIFISHLYLAKKVEEKTHFKQTITLIVIYTILIILLIILGM
jgi:hypothetical protein